MKPDQKIVAIGAASGVAVMALSVFVIPLKNGIHPGISKI